MKSEGTFGGQCIYVIKLNCETISSESGLCSDFGYPTSNVNTYLNRKLKLSSSTEKFVKCVSPTICYKVNKYLGDNTDIYLAAV